jgi:hypothetical protein
MASLQGTPGDLAAVDFFRNGVDDLTGSDREATKQNLIGMRQSVKSGIADVSFKAPLCALQRAFDGGEVSVCIPSRLIRTGAHLCKCCRRDRSHPWSQSLGMPARGANNGLYFPQRMCMMCSIRLEAVDIAVSQRARMVVPKPRRETLMGLSDLGRIDVLINTASFGGSTMGFPSIAAVMTAQLHRLTGVNPLPGRRRRQSKRLSGHRCRARR